MQSKLLFIFLLCGTAFVTNAQIEPAHAFDPPHIVSDTLYGVSLRLDVGHVIRIDKKTGKNRQYETMLTVADEAYCIRTRQLPCLVVNTSACEEVRYYILSTNQQIPFDEMLLFKIRKPVLKN